MDNATVSVDHYENFPVASWLCPPAIRPAVVAIYGFARAADDIADEGNAPAAERLEALHAYAGALERAAIGQPGGRWEEVFVPLSVAIRDHALPLPLLRDLLSAFAQDTANPVYADRAALLHYCSRSANPIGRLLLHLYGVRDATSLRRSDAICTSLQLINFWQDLSVDQPRGRLYVTLADAERHGLTPQLPRAPAERGKVRTLMKELCQWSRELMHSGAPLSHTLPGRLGWELRLVIQGGLRILDKIEALNWDTLQSRPTLRAVDVPLMFVRAVFMRRAPVSIEAAHDA